MSNGFVPGFCDSFADVRDCPFVNPCNFEPMLCGEPAPVGNIIIRLPPETPPTLPGEDIINNNITVVNQGIEQVAGAVTQGVNGAILRAGQIVNAAIGKISTTLDSISTRIWDGVKTAIASLVSHIGDILSHIGSILKDIFAHLVDVISGLLTKIGDFLGPILTQIHDVLKTVTDLVRKLNDEFIKPIADLYNTTIRTIATLTVAIERDLHDGIAGLLKIPTDLAAGLSSLDAVINRSLEQLGAGFKVAINAGLVDGSGKNVSDNAGAIARSIEAMSKPGQQTVSFTDFVALVDHCDLATWTDLTAKNARQIEGAQGWTSWFEKLVQVILFYPVQLAGLIETASEEAKERARVQCPIKKLDQSSAIEAFNRRFIDESALKSELNKQGFSDERIRILRDLTAHVDSPGELVDYLYRGIIRDSDLVVSLQNLGFSDGQISAAREAGVKIFDTGLALTAFRYRLITEDELRSILTLNRMSEAEITAVIDTAFRPPNTQEVLEGGATRLLYAELNLPGEKGITIIDQGIDAAHGGNLGSGVPAVEDAARFARAGIAQGMNDAAIRNAWYAAQSTLDLPMWMTLYFRGHRTLTELRAVMDRFRIPTDLQMDVIDAQRALIPFRTIPAMLAAGVLSEMRAIEILQGHGYSLGDAHALLTFATAKASKTAHPAALATHDISLASAKALFDDGAITEEQYRIVLADHGLTPSAVDLQVKATVLQAQVAERKATAQNITDLAVEGAITIDEAQQQLSVLGYTHAEIVKYMKTLKRARVKVSKVPSEAELNHMMQRSIISQDDYVQALELQGFSSMWAGAFLKLRVSPA